MSALNPNNEVLQTLEGHWHKILFVLMMQQGIKEFEITERDAMKLHEKDGELCIVADCRNGRTMIRLVTMEEGRRLARQEGGLPT